MKRQQIKAIKAKTSIKYKSLSNKKLSDLLYRASYTQNKNNSIRVNLNKEADRRNKMGVQWWK